MKITGELLKAERANRGLTIQQVAQSLKISSKIISSIEAGAVDQLPAKTFLRGFVRSYAEFLKMDPDAVLRQFQEEMGSTSPLPKVPPPTPEQSDKINAPRPALRQTSQNYSQTKSVTSASIKQQNLEEQNINNKILMFLFGAVVLLVLIVGGVKLFESDNSIPVATNTESDTTNVIIPKFDSLDVAAASGTTETATNSTSATIVSGTTTASVGAPAAIEAPVPAINEEDVPPSAGKPIELILESKKDVEIFFAKGNTKVFKPLKLVANKMHIIRSATGLHLKATDGGAFKITANGVDIGNAGPNNKPVKLSF